ncbi:MAG: hypothetical protein IKS07_10855 [Lachnospiraceae bacterium]|nr:hypothetical protein [Lachnospiraceae bacterium]
MKIVQMECPNCGAKLQVNEELTYANCNFCGQQFLIEREKTALETGYDFERGREAATRKSAEELRQKVTALVEPIKKLEMLNQQILVLQQAKSDLQTKIDALEPKVEKTESEIGRDLPLILPSAILAAFLVIALVTGGGIATLLTGLVFAAIAFGIIVSIWTTNRQNLDGFYNSLGRTEQSLSDDQRALDEIVKKNDFGIIPGPYRKSEAMRAFAYYFTSGRVSTIQEAVRAYEEDLHRERMESLQKIQIDELRKQQEMMERMHQEQQVQRQVNVSNAVAGAAVAGVAGVVAREAIKSIKDQL